MQYLNNIKKQGAILLLLFLIIIISGSVYSIMNIKAIVATMGRGVIKAYRGECSVSDILMNFEKYYDSLYSKQIWLLDSFSITQKILGKKEVRNFVVLKSDSGDLYLSGDENDIDIDYIKNIGQASDLLDYSKDVTEEKYNYLDRFISELGIPVLDLREFVECKNYYRTDHHWTVKAGFNASRIIVDISCKMYNLKNIQNDYYGNESNYNVISYDNCFLGSIGIKVGSFFAGKDDFEVLIPKFKTDLDFKHYNNKELQFKKIGVFFDTFIDNELLKDKNYHNKYDANMFGAYVESIIRNYKSQNNYKVLLVTNSYGRTMAPYMCLNFSELRYLDPQIGRFNGNIVDYINQFKPDIVVLMYNDKVNVGN